MRYALATLLVMALTVTSMAFAQDGGVHGPPKAPIIITPQTPVPSTTSPTGPLRALFQPKSPLAH